MSGSAASSASSAATPLAAWATTSTSLSAELVAQLVARQLFVVHDQGAHRGSLVRGGVLMPGCAPG